MTDDSGRIDCVVIPEGFGRAAEKLADTVRHVVNLSSTANRVRTTDQAQAESEIILAKARAEVAEIEARTIERRRKTRDPATIQYRDHC